MSDELLELTLSDAVRSMALQDFNGELGWKRSDLPEVIAELEQKNYSILGIDLWAVEAYDDNDKLESLKVIYLNVKNIIKGPLPLASGGKKPFRVFFEKEENESYLEFVHRSSKEAKISVNRINAENLVDERYADRIFYHLIFTDKI